MPEYAYIGKSLPRVDGVAKATGQAVFASDVSFPGMLHACILRSPYAHAVIKNMDTSRAEKLPGVKAVVTGKEAPEVGLGIFLRQILPCQG
jgi:4-hydroxybenzoyl-CoA reductase subunit alpha